MKLRKLLAAVLVGVMTVSSLAISAFAADEKGTVPAPGEFDANGEYVAQMYVQMDGSWVFRNKWDDKDYGTAMGYQYAGQLSQVESGNAVPYDGTFTDVALKGNGTYTIKLENPNFVKDVNGTKTEPKKFNMIGISTNIPASAQDTVKITDATIKINDSSMYTYTWKEALVDEEESVLAVSAALVAVSAAAVVSSAVVASTALSYPKPDTVNVISMLVTSPINVLSSPPSCSLTAS